MTKLYNFTTYEVASPDNVALLLNACEHGKAEYIFRNERYATKEEKLIDTIKRNNVATFSLKVKPKSTSTVTVKSMSKKLDKALRDIPSRTESSI